MSGRLQSVQRAMRMLEAVGGSADGMTAKELAGQFDLTLPTTYHLLGTLVEAGYLVHLVEEHSYVLGYRIRMLDTALQRQLAVPGEVASAVRAVHRQADAAAYYAVYRHSEVVVVHVEDSQRRPRIQHLDVGFHGATHATALGKVMLAALDPDRLGSYLSSRGMPRLTASTICRRPVLEAQLDRIRESGIAMDNEEFERGTACMAAPVRDQLGAVAASVAVSVPPRVLRQRRWALERAVRQGAAAITRALSAAGRIA